MYKKNDVVVLLNGNKVVVAQRRKTKYVVYPLLQYGSPYLSLFTIDESEIKCRSSIYIG